MGVDGDRSDDTISHSAKMGEGQKDVSHVPLMNGTLSNEMRAAKNKQKTKNLMYMGFLKNKKNEKKKLTCPHSEPVQWKETGQEEHEFVF